MTRDAPPHIRHFPRRRPSAAGARGATGLAARIAAWMLALALAPPGLAAAARGGEEFGGAPADERSPAGRLARTTDRVFTPLVENPAPADPRTGQPNDGGLVYLPLPYWGPDGLSTADTPEKLASVLQLIAMITLITLAPGILVMVTCFTRILIVMGFIRRALATQTLPPDQVMVGLSLFLTFFIMYPTWKTSWTEGLMPYFDGTPVAMEAGMAPRPMTQVEAFERVLAPHRAFMFACLEQNEGREELYFFMGMAGERITPEREGTITRADVPTHALIPAFITAELRRAFWMGFLLYLPFLILDMAISSVLMSMGMMMLPPVMISLPFKIILFVMVDGWRLLMEGVVTSFPESVLSSMTVEPPAVVPSPAIYPSG